MAHTATITEGPTGFVLTCLECGEFGSANELELAKMLGRFHENAFELAAVAEELAG